MKHEAFSDQRVSHLPSVRAWRKREAAINAARAEAAAEWSRISATLQEKIDNIEREYRHELMKSEIAA